MENKDSKFNETDIYRIRKNSRLNQGLFLCKLILKKHGTVQIEGMGECISLVAKVSQILLKNGFAVVKNINSQSVERENNKSINPKLAIKMEKTANFDDLTKNIVLKSWSILEVWGEILLSTAIFSSIFPWFFQSIPLDMLLHWKSVIFLFLEFQFPTKIKLLQDINITFPWF